MAHHGQVGFIPVVQGWFNTCRSIQEIQQLSRMHYKSIWSTDTISLIGSEKAFGRIQHPYMIENVNKLDKQGRYSDSIKAMYHKPTAMIMLKGEKLKPFLQDQW